MGSGSVRSSHQAVSDYTLRQWFSNTRQSRFLTACRRLEKLVLHSILTQVFYPWWCETWGVIQQQFWMEDCDILGGGKNILCPSYIFSRDQDPNPQHPRPHGRSIELSAYQLLPTSCTTLLYSTYFKMVTLNFRFVLWNAESAWQLNDENSTLVIFGFLTRRNENISSQNIKIRN